VYCCIIIFVTFFSCSISGNLLCAVNGSFPTASLKAASYIVSGYNTAESLVNHVIESPWPEYGVLLTMRAVVLGKLLSPDW